MGRYADVDYLLKNNAVKMDWSGQKWVSEVSLVSAINLNVAPIVHGHWERIPNTPTWKCSICGYEITGFIDRDGLTPMDCKENYCFRCGAKMDEKIDL